MNTRSFTIILPDNIKAFSDCYLLALATYREARGEGLLTKTGVAWTIKNRTLHPSWWGSSLFEVITHPFQFSSFNHNDPNVVVFGPPEEQAWKDSVQVAFDVMTSNVPDPTAGADSYYDKSLDKNPPKWALKAKPTTIIGSMRFFIVR